MIRPATRFSPFEDLPTATALFVGASCAVFRLRRHVGDMGPDGRSTIQAPLVAIPRSACRLSISGGRPFVADRNTMVLFNVGDTVERLALSGVLADSDLLAFKPDLLRDVLHSLERMVDRTHGRGAFPCNYVFPTPDLYLAMRKLTLAMPGAGFPGAVMEARLIEILRQVVLLSLRQANGHRKAPDTPRTSSAVMHARQLLAARIDAPLSLDQVAAGVHMSPYHLARAFKQHCGTTIHGYRMRLRMSQALNLLVHPALSISGVAGRLGFCAHSHFSNAFRRHFGITPGSFVRALR